MAIGGFLVGASFVVMIAVAGSTGTGQDGLLWPIVCTLLITVGELYFVPISLSLLTRVAPLRLVSTMIAAFVLPSFVGNVLSGYLGVFGSQGGGVSRGRWARGSGAR